LCARRLELLKLSPEPLDVILAHFLDRHFEESPRRKHRFIPAGEARKNAHGMVAVEIRLLADRAMNFTINNALQRLVLFIERHHLDLAGFASAFDRLHTRWR